MEVRRRAVKPAMGTSITARGDADSIFSDPVNLVVAEYATLATALSQAPIVLRHTAYGYGSPGSNWLVLDPMLGHRLGWKPSDRGMFRWIDNLGETTVEASGGRMVS